VNYPSSINRDIKSVSLAEDLRPAPRRYGYLLLAGLTTLIAIALLSGNSEPARALQNTTAVVATQDSISEALILPQQDAFETVTVPALQPEVTAAVTPAVLTKTTPVPAPAPAPETRAATPADTDGNWHQVTVKSGDSLATIFNKLDISAQQLHALLEQGGAAHNLKKIHPGQKLRVLTDEKQGLVKLSYPIDKLSTLEVSRNGEEFDISTSHRTPERREVSASATINSSLFLAANKAGMSDNITMELAGIFGWDIDFALDIRKGDSFTVLYEEIYLDGEHIDNGEILAAEFVNQGKRYQAVRYTDAGGRTDYYALNGESMRKTFLRTPVEFSRISSRFSTGRKHPILNKIRAHKGVDYAASTGTPIKSTANGKIIHIGKKGGYGNTIIVQHGTRYSTLYAHMSKYRGGLKNGSRVRQGQTIGYIGSSGLATGPHLHYELRVDGTHRDPLRVKLPGADPLNKKYMDDFSTRAETLMAQIDLVRDVQVASSQ
jgi:murein DD-endopeptidase MepM/ murein hydrolase activator NlpD